MLFSLRCLKDRLTFTGISNVGSQLLIKRSFFQQSAKSKQYAERRLLGYSAEQMFDVVNNVGAYSEWLPWCQRSDVYNQRPDGFNCLMEVGFPPFVERYTSKVTYKRPEEVISICYNGILFKELRAIWRFSDGMESKPDTTCTLDFDVLFEFRSALHSHASHLFFDQVVKTQISAFLKRAHQLYGPESIRRQRPQILRYENVS